MISSGMSSKILKEALLQQKEIDDEVRDQNPNNAFLAVEEEPTKDEEEDVDDFAGFDDTQSHFGGYEVGLFFQNFIWDVEKMVWRVAILASPWAMIPLDLFSKSMSIKKLLIVKFDFIVHFRNWGYGPSAVC